METPAASASPKGSAGAPEVEHRLGRVGLVTLGLGPELLGGDVLVVGRPAVLVPAVGVGGHVDVHVLHRRLAQHRHEGRDAAGVGDEAVVGREDVGVHRPHRPDGPGQRRRRRVEHGDEAGHAALDDLLVDDVGHVEAGLGPGLGGVVDLDRDGRAGRRGPARVDQAGQRRQRPARRRDRAFRHRRLRGDGGDGLRLGAAAAGRGGQGGETDDGNDRCAAEWHWNGSLLADARSLLDISASALEPAVRQSELSTPLLLR